MICYSPLNIKGYTFPCGKCNFCLQTKQLEWVFRIKQEQKHNPHSQFVTLTYDNNNIPYGAEQYVLHKPDLQKFFKRLRKRVNPQQIRYYAVGEYGERTNRPHYHVILFGLRPNQTDYIRDSWTLGLVHIGRVNDSTITYCAKYITAKQAQSYEVKPFALMSRRPAIGAKYLETHTNWHLADYRNYTKQNGIYGRLPRYYKRKIFTTEFQKEQITLRNEELIKQQNEKLWTHLKQHHPDPEQYYQEMVTLAHTKINVHLTKNKL